MRLKVVIFLSAITLLTSCTTSESDKKPDTTSEATSESAEDTDVLSTIENPFQFGEKVNTEGWEGLQFDLLFRVPPEIAEIYDYGNYDPSLDYILVGFMGTNKGGEKANLYDTVATCEKSGTVGKSGVFREIIVGDPLKTEMTGLKIMTYKDNEVLDGFEDINTAIYKIERGDTSAVIMSQSKLCGTELDFVVAVGDVSDVPFLEK